MHTQAYITRHLYHMRWVVKYSLVSLLCLWASLWVWPDRRGLMLMAVGYGFAALARRERRRAGQVHP